MAKSWYETTSEVDGLACGYTCRHKVYVLDGALAKPQAATPDPATIAIYIPSSYFKCADIVISWPVRKMTTHS